MSLIKLPEGVELDLKVYLVGQVEDEEMEIVLTVGGMPSFSDDVHRYVELSHIIKSYKLNDLGSDWRVMTRDEIKDYKAKAREAD